MMTTLFLSRKNWQGRDISWSSCSREPLEEEEEER